MKVQLSMLKFSCSKILMHCFYFDINEGKICIGYGMVIMWDTMVKLGLITDLKKNRMLLYHPYKNNPEG